ncbi:unnamed protein product [Chrysoparadoxa australica]
MRALPLLCLCSAACVNGFAPIVELGATVPQTWRTQPSAVPKSAFLSPPQPVDMPGVLKSRASFTAIHGSGAGKEDEQRFESGASRLGSLATKAGVIATVVLAVTHALPLPAAAAQLTTPVAGIMAEGSSLIDRLNASGFFQAFSLVFVSEIGDKTFFIAGLLAAKTSRLISFTGSVGALAVMTVISCVIGVVAHSVPAFFTSGGIPYDDILAAAAFLYFGLNTLKGAYDLPDDDNSGIEGEKADAEEAIQDVVAKPGSSGFWALILQTFSLVFAAEFGDRSFITTIALAAAQNPVSVCLGGITAHASATGIAVAGGALLSQYISEKVIGYIGGSLFLVFAATTAVGVF